MVRHTHPFTGYLAICVAIVVIAALLAKDPDPSDRASGPYVDLRTDAQARADCQDAITPKLRSPSTADFPYSEQRFTVLNDTTGVLVGVVDAQNGFGATTRDDVTCTYRKKPAETVWTLHNAKLTEG